MSNKNKMRFFFKSVVNRKMGYIIPIVENNGRFLTGQDLTYKQMVGEEPLTESQRLKYPFVINPNVMHKVRHNSFMDTTIPETAALVELALLSGRIAANKSEYNVGVHDGYIINPEFEADAEVKAFNMVSEAFAIIRDTKSEDLDILVLLASLQPNSSNMEGLFTEKQKLSALYKLAQSHPANIINCSPKHNSTIKDQLFVAYCIKHKIILKKGSNYVIREDGQDIAYLGTTMVKAIAYLDANSTLKDKLYTKLKEVEPFYNVLIADKIAVSQDKYSLEDLAGQISVSIDKDLDTAKDLLAEYKERVDGTITEDYLFLYRKFRERQIEYDVDVFEKDLIEADGRRLNMYLISPKSIYKPFADEIKALPTDEEKKSKIVDIYREKELEKLEVEISKMNEDVINE